MWNAVIAYLLGDKSKNTLSVAGVESLLLLLHCNTYRWKHLNHALIFEILELFLFQRVPAYVTKKDWKTTVPALTFVAISIKIISVIPVPEYLFDRECGFPNPIIY